MRTNDGAQPTRDRLHEIDLLRITAALGVVIYHCTFSGQARHLTSIAYLSLSVVTRYGYLGVDMFFTISGFVVLPSAWGRRPHEFVISRVVRLYPAYWVAVTLTTVVALTLSRGIFHVTPIQYVANMTMLTAVAHIANIDVVYWTLDAEIRFYLLIFVLAWVGITRTQVIAVLWTWLVATAVIELHVLPAGPSATLDILVQSQWSHYFIGGMALCLIYRTGFSWQLGAILVIAYANAVHQAINFGHLVADPLYLVHAYSGFVIINLIGRYLNRWLLLAVMLTGMCGVAYAVHRFIEATLGARLKRGLTRLVIIMQRP